jgi:phosphate transport system permease protein
MTSLTSSPSSGISSRVGFHTSDVVRARVKDRYRAERRFRLMGLSGIVVAALFLVVFLSSIVSRGYAAFFQHYLSVDISLPKEELDPKGTMDLKAIGAGDYDGMVRKTMQGFFPHVSDRKERKALNGIVSSGSPIALRRQVLANPVSVGSTTSIRLPLNGNADLYLKGRLFPVGVQNRVGNLTASAKTGAVELTGAANLFAPLLKSTSGSPTILDLTSDLKAPSILVQMNGGIIKLSSIEAGKALGEVLVPLSNDAALSTDTWQLHTISTPEADRKLSDREIAFLENLKERGFISKRLSTEFFTQGASREAEQAGVWVAVIGSIMTLLIVMLVSFPLGVGAAMYLEEFAPKNRLTDIIEVNINNLAAVPSIIFGLLGLAIFLNVFGMPRSAPVVGGLVLALMTLPVIIIATRASLRAVPPSIKEAALGVGASHQQAVFHHVLPMAMPGILTGTILGMARAMGETAPLLMIGMVAFLVDSPRGFTDAATLLPVQIFMWADFPEAAFQDKTAAAILVLLVFMMSMNVLAVILRKKFERRW